MRRGVIDQLEPSPQPSVEVIQIRDLTLRVSADHANPIDCADCVAIGRLEAHRHFLFALDQLCRNLVFDVEEIGVLLLRAEPRDGLFSHLDAFHQDIEGSVLLFAAVVGHYKSHGMS